MVSGTKTARSTGKVSTICKEKIDVRYSLESGPNSTSSILEAEILPPNQYCHLLSLLNRFAEILGTFARNSSHVILADIANRPILDKNLPLFILPHMKTDTVTKYHTETITNETIRIL
ncbi:hypothetical protein AVEN_54741-1 [Araneus ventricosus]|uniref:Uncharacterized protein n=1 Tax=Araneus ventricosus TaxID=182803 RepID=A0A4Y2FB16_ARAVE|nr:hypothetical protein AVEN_54741-1 [Araneus ventricosus]